MVVPAGRAEVARALLAERFPEGWEERVGDDGVEMAVYGGQDAGRLLEELLGGASQAEVPDDWESRWREFHRPVSVGPLWIGPPWEAPPEGALAVVVEPGRAFGTGAHPTTRLCLSLLLEERPASVVDLGCGSGVLSIAAARLGFAPVEAVDRDRAAVEVCAANAGRNGVEVGVRALDLLEELPPPAELALANLERGLLEAVGPGIPAQRLIASGYLAGDAPRIAGWRPVASRTLEGWEAGLFEPAPGSR